MNNNSIPTAEDILSILIPQKDNVSKEENEDSLKQNVDTLRNWCNLHIQELLKQVEETIIASDDLQLDIIGGHYTMLNSYPIENIN